MATTIVRGITLKIVLEEVEYISEVDDIFITAATINGRAAWDHDRNTLQNMIRVRDLVLQEVKSRQIEEAWRQHEGLGPRPLAEADWRAA